MNFKPYSRIPRTLLAAGVLVAVVALGACSTSGKKPQPGPLPTNSALLGVKQIWTAQVGSITEPLTLKVSADGTQVLAAGGSKGDVYAFNATTGQQLWHGSAGARVTAGVGSDGNLAAVVNENNELVTFRSNGDVAWRQPLGARTYTSPLVAGKRVFVLTADRVLALDGETGRRLWSQPRTGEPLLLRESGALFPLGNTLVVGVGGRLLGTDPMSGEVRWQGVIATSRGANDIERLVEVVGGVNREGSVLCARAYQARVSCIDTARGGLLWSKSANGYTGLGGDASQIYGTESDGRVIAWQRANGDAAWTLDALRWRDLSAPLALGRAVAVGDGQGLLHLLSREDGSTLARLSTDGSAIRTQPVLAGNTLVVATSKGTLYGFRPE